MSTLGNFNVGTGDTTQSPLSENWGLNKVSNWKPKFCIIPRKCFLTGKRLWFTTCYAGSRMITGPGTPIYDDYYIDKIEFLIWKLTR